MYARTRVMGSYISNRNVCAQTWNLFNDDRCHAEFSDMYARTRVRGVLHFEQKCLRTNMALAQDVRAWPVAQRAAFEAQIPTEVLRQDQSRSPVHHEGAARKAALSLPWRTIDRSQDRGRQSPDC